MQKPFIWLLVGCCMLVHSSAINFQLLNSTNFNDFRFHNISIYLLIHARVWFTINYSSGTVLIPILIISFKYTLYNYTKLLKYNVSGELNQWISDVNAFIQYNRVIYCACDSKYAYIIHSIILKSIIFLIYTYTYIYIYN